MVAAISQNSTPAHVGKWSLANRGLNLTHSDPNDSEAKINDGSNFSSNTQTVVRQICADLRTDDAQASVEDVYNDPTHDYGFYIALYDQPLHPSSKLLEDVKKVCDLATISTNPYQQTIINGHRYRKVIHPKPSPQLEKRPLEKIIEEKLAQAEAIKTEIVEETISQIIKQLGINNSLKISLGEKAEIKIYTPIKLDVTVENNNGSSRNFILGFEDYIGRKWTRSAWFYNNQISQDDKSEFMLWLKNALESIYDQQLVHLPENLYPPRPTTISRMGHFTYADFTQ